MNKFFQKSEIYLKRLNRLLALFLSSLRYVLLIIILIGSIYGTYGHFSDFNIPFARFLSSNLGVAEV